jgi:D-alanyl-D-alanine carboxypeptidase
MVLTNVFTITFAEPATEVTTQAATEATTATATDTAGTDTSVTVNAEACILIDAETGVILYEKNSHEKLYPASITKVMTTLLACENGNFDDTITFSHNAVFNIGEGSSHIGIDEGEQLNFKDALYGILLASANEVCMGVAEHIDGTVEAFVDRMNAKAKELGCEDTHFANPHGFHDPDHYTTCYDMSLIVKAAVQNEKFLEIFSTVDHTIPATNKNVERYLHNKDKMMRPTSPYYYENIIGGKTGYHDQALNTLVTYAGKDDVKLITVVMKDQGAALAYADTKTLMEYGFSLYEDKTLLTADNFSTEIPVIQPYKDEINELGNVTLKPASDFSANVPNFINASDLKLEPNLPENMQAPVEVGASVGTLDIYYGDYQLGSVELVTSTGLDAIPQSELEQRARAKELQEKAAKTVNIIKTHILYIVIALVVIIIIILLIKHRRKRTKKVYRYGSGGKKKKKSSPKKKKVRYKVKLK